MLRLKQIASILPALPAGGDARLEVRRLSIKHAVSRYLAYGIRGANHERSRNQCLTSIVKNLIGAGASSFSKPAK